MQTIPGWPALEAPRTWLNRDPRGTPTIGAGLERLTGRPLDARSPGILSTPLPRPFQAAAQRLLGSAGAGSAQAERGVGERPRGQGDGRLQPFTVHAVRGERR